MQRLDVSGAVRPIYGSLGVKQLKYIINSAAHFVGYLYIMETVTLFFVFLHVLFSESSVHK